MCIYNPSSPAFSSSKASKPMICKDKLSTAHGTFKPNGSSTSKAGWDYLDYAYDFLSFMNHNPTEFHAVAELKSRLDKEGFVYLSERDNWYSFLTAFETAKGKEQGAKKFYTTRNNSSIVACTLGPDWTPARGVGIAGCHIDALTVKLKPVSLVETSAENGGYLRLGVAPYSGALSSVWWDRDLGLAGRLIVRESDAKKGGKEVVRQVLVKMDHPIGKVPTLAPHFGTPARGPFNKETNMVPIIGLQDEDVPEATDEEKQSPVVGDHDIRVLRAVCKQAGVKVSSVQAVELQLYDFQSGVLGGLDQEFLICGRLDDKLCSYAALRGLIESDVKADGFNMVALFDNEEVGSLTRQGANGRLIEAVVDRVLATLPAEEASSSRQLYANSFFVSADTTHAVNPNFAAEYLDLHKPKLNTGVTLKFNLPGNANTTDSVSSTLIRTVCRTASPAAVPLQVFHVRNDGRSGGTIGPTVSSALGCRSVDVGIPQLAMHSIRATTGTKDVGLGVGFFRAFFGGWKAVDDSFEEGL